MNKSLLIFELNMGILNATLDRDAHAFNVHEFLKTSMRFHRPQFLDTDVLLLKMERKNLVHDYVFCLKKIGSHENYLMQ